MARLISWHSAKSEAAGVVSGLANKEKRARSSSSNRSRSASRGSSLRVSGRPPAQGLPAQGGELIQLQPPLWTQKARLILRLFPELRCELVTTNIALFLVEAPPPLCNRMGVEWGKPMAGCHCELWPEWTRKNLGVTTACFRMQEPIVDRDGKAAVAKQGVKLLYWRSGKKNRPCWYNGSVLEGFLVRFPSGRQKPVVALN